MSIFDIPPTNQDTAEQTNRQKTDKTPQESNLEDGEAANQKKLGGGANEGHIIDIKGDGKGVFKPKNGEKINLRTETECGTYYKRERATYLVSKFVGLDMVPSTVIRDIDGKIGSMQEFIPNTSPGYEFINGLLEQAETRPECKNNLFKMWVLDYLTWNSDRHDSNFLIDDKNELIAIDNGLSFSPERPIFYLPETLFSDEEKDAAIKTLEKTMDITPREIKLLKELLSELLDQEEVEAFDYRLAKLQNFLSEYRNGDPKEMLIEWNNLDLTYSHDNPIGCPKKPKFYSAAEPTL